MIILGIETSCDETALALIETRDGSGGLECRIIQSLVHSQADLHSAYGGVFPNLAKREHSKNLVPLLEKLLNEANGEARPPNILTDKEFDEVISSMSALLADKNQDLLETIPHAHFLKKIPRIDRIAVTEGPGLEPALWVGINFARVLSALWGVPIVPVNHMEGHIVGSLLSSDKPYGTWQKLQELPLPAVALLISGGHTELVKIASTKSSGETFKYTIIGQTKDDAVGEAFDKVARLLELPYPGGPHVSKLSYEAREKNISAPVKLPRPMIGSDDCDFSFSGLKTAVLYTIRKAGDTGGDGTKSLTYEFKAGLAREFEDSVADVLDKKLRRAIDASSAVAIVVGGGVSANRILRERFKKVAAEYDIPLFLPTQHVTGDNALMIAVAGAMHAKDTKSAKITPRDLCADGTKSLL